MANPAELLWQTFEQWHKPGPQSNARDTRADHTLAAHRMAVRQLDAIDALLGQLESAGRNTSVYRRHFPNWVRIVFNYPNNWIGNGSANIDQNARDHLSTLADVLSTVVPKAAIEKFDELRTFLDGLEEAIEQDESLPQDAKAYARVTIRGVRQSLDNYATEGDYRLQEVLEQLLGMLVRVAAKSRNRERFQWFFTNFVYPFVVNQAPALPIAGLLELMP